MTGTLARHFDYFTLKVMYVDDAFFHGAWPW
jgi:hypothetical protein